MLSELIQNIHLNYQSVVYSPTNALVSILKNNIKIYIKTAPKFFGVTVTRSNTNLQHLIFYINRILTPPITKRAKQQEWKIILAIAQNNGFPLYIIHTLNKKLITKKQRQTPPPNHNNTKNA